MGTKTPMIAAAGLGKTYGETTAVECLDLQVAEGELFCFLGPNGAGKTTTIKMLIGLTRPSRGRASVGGFDIVQQPLEVKRLVGFVPDTPMLYDKLTGRELMRFVAGLHGLPDDQFEARCEPLLEAFEVLEVADRLIEGYSHGMRQKLSFAVCFLNDPRLVVVDEPWVGLDPKNIRKIKDDLKYRCQQGLTVFMSTHTLSIAEEMADRVGIIHRGRLLHTGTVDEIKALAQHPGSLEDVFLQLTSEAEAAL